MKMISMLENDATLPEGFLWGMAVATIGWISLSVFSALALGLMIRRSNGTTHSEDHQPEADARPQFDAKDSTNTGIRTKDALHHHGRSRASNERGNG